MADKSTEEGPALQKHDGQLQIENQDKLWDYYQVEMAPHFDGTRGRQAFLAATFKPGQRVLNIGVGGGIFEEIALARGIEVYSLDPSSRSIEALRTRLQLGDRAQVGYSQNMPFKDRQFDGVIFSEVLEHLSDEIIRQSLQETRRVLVPGGILIVTVPARENLRESLVVCPDCGKLFHRWGHLQSFDPARIRSLLEPHFTVLELQERPFITWSALNWKGKIMTGLKGLLWLLGVHGSGETMYVRSSLRP